MAHSNKWRIYLTEGERSILFALFGLGIYGAIIAFLVVNELGDRGQIIRPLTQYDIWIIFCGAIGAPAGAVLGRKWFGHPGQQGWLRACAGVVIVGFIGSIVAGTLALPFYGTMFGPLSLFVTMVGSPLLAVVWVTMLLCGHLMVAVYRRERDTIFAPQPKRRRVNV